VLDWEAVEVCLDLVRQSRGEDPRALAWEREHEEVLARSRLVLGDPAAGEVYGFLARRGPQAIPCLRNPSDRSQPVGAAWPDLLGFRPTTLTPRYGRLTDVLDPFEVMVVEATSELVPRT